MGDVTAAALRLVEAVSVAQKWRELDALVAKGQAAVGKAFADQGRAFVRAFGELRPYFLEGYCYPHPMAIARRVAPPTAAAAVANAPGSDVAVVLVREASPVPDDVWLRLWDDVARQTLGLMLAPIVDINELGLVLGAGALAGALGMDFEKAFSLKNPRAVAYLEQHGAALVTKINEETRSQMKTLITQAVDEGWSYTRTAKAIKEQFDGFAGLKPQQHIRDRATLVAVTEAGQAYEEGSLIVAKGLGESGIPMQKYWRTSGDERVSQGCKDNQAAGWIGLEELFPSGHERPLRFPGCRCSANFRRAR